MMVKESDRAKLCDLIDSSSFALAIERIRRLAADHDVRKWWATSRCDEIETLYRQMLVYSLSPIDDPGRSALIKRIQYDLYRLTDDLIEEIELQKGNGYDYRQKRVFAIEHILDFSHITDKLRDSGEGAYSDESMAVVNQLWRHVWLVDGISADEEERLGAIVADDTLIMPARAVIVSALTLRSLRVYDPVALRLALRLCDLDDRALRIRVLVLLLAIVACHHRVIAYEHEALCGRIDELFADKDFMAQMVMVLQVMVNTLETEKITKKIETEVYDDLRKYAHKFREVDFDESAGGDVSPKWTERLMEDESLSAKMRQFSEMQAGGADIYMSTFSRMKNFPFFNFEMNWFLPFDERNPEVYDVVSKLPMLMRNVMRSPMMCSSDRYSLVLSLKGVSADNISMMASVDPEAGEQLQEELKTNGWEKRDDAMLWLTRNYVQDLYRFYNIYHSARSMPNPISRIIGFTANSGFMSFFPMEAGLKVAREMVAKEAWSEAIALFSQLERESREGDHSVVDHRFYQQLAYANQRLGNYAVARDYYIRATLYGDDDVWTRKQRALCCRKTGDYAGAAVEYEAILTQQEDDVPTMINLMNCHLRLRQYEAARTVGYKAYYIDSDNVRIVRMLAWCMFLEGDFAKSVEFYAKIIDTDMCDATDLLNYAHICRAAGDNNMAYHYYCETYKRIGNSDDFVRLMRNDMEFLCVNGAVAEDAFLLIDRVVMLGED